MIFGQIMYVASDLSKPSTIHAVSLGLEHGGAAQYRSKLSDNFFFLPEIFREIFALRARSDDIRKDDLFSSRFEPSSKKKLTH